MNKGPNYYTDFCTNVTLIVIDEAHLVVSWGLRKGAKDAFRPAMALSTGELSGICGQMLLMTATASSRTIRLLKDEMPEIKKWNLILNSPFRGNVSILVPPPETLSAKYEVLLKPFITRMKMKNEVYLILVRGMENGCCIIPSCRFLFLFEGINKGSSIYLHILKQLGLSEDGQKRVAFFHRNTSDARKQDILEDLKKPISSQGKKLIAVVATVSLGKPYSIIAFLLGFEKNLWNLVRICCG